MALGLRLLLIAVGALYVARMILDAPAQLRAAESESPVFRRLIITRLIGLGVLVVGYLILVVALQRFHAGMTIVYVLEGIVGFGLVVTGVSAVSLGWLEGRRDARRQWHSGE